MRGVPKPPQPAEPLTVVIGYAGRFTVALKQLLAAIHDAPDDDALRAVYADALLERDDPLGEFIALQLTRGANAATPREQELVKVHGKRWAGKLGECFDPTTWIFERGFFAGGSVYRPVTAKRLRGIRGSRLVTHLRCRQSPQRTLPLVDVLPALRSLDTMSSTAVKLACRDRLHPLCELACFMLDSADDELAVLGTCAALPALRRLEVFASVASQAAWLEQAPIVDRVEVLTVAGDGMNRELVHALHARRSKLVVEYSGWTATIEGGTARIDGSIASLSYIAAALLDRLPRHLALRFAVTIEEATRRAIEPLFGEFASVTELPANRIAPIRRARAQH